MTGLSPATKYCPLAGVEIVTLMSNSGMLRMSFVGEVVGPSTPAGALAVAARHAGVS